MHAIFRNTKLLLMLDMLDECKHDAANRLMDLYL